MFYELVTVMILWTFVFFWLNIHLCFLNCMTRVTAKITNLIHRLEEKPSCSHTIWNIIRVAMVMVVSLLIQVSARKQIIFFSPQTIHLNYFHQFKNYRAKTFNLRKSLTLMVFYFTSWTSGSFSLKREVTQREALAKAVWESCLAEARWQVCCEKEVLTLRSKTNWLGPCRGFQTCGFLLRKKKKTEWEAEGSTGQTTRPCTPPSLWPDCAPHIHHSSGISFINVCNSPVCDSV